MISELQIAGLGAAYLVVEIVKFLVTKFTAKGTYGERDRLWLHDLHEMHSKVDDTGRPLVYSPVNIYQYQEKTLELLHKMSNNQKDISHILERVLEKLDRR